jgi:uncharacterized DUF497 family protein
MPINWRRFVPGGFEYDWDADKLAEHELSFEEAVEAFFNPYVVRRNKKFRDRFKMIGQTDGGRKLKLIFQLKPNKVVRIITGWEI